MRILFLLFPASALAAENVGVPAGTYLQAGFALIFIVALLFGAAWMLRKVSGDKGFGQGGMKILGGVALGPRERIVLLEVGEDCLVVGIVPGQIRTLHRLPKSKLPADATTLTPTPPFADWLKRVTEREHHA